ncbi:hypothetical protein ACJMK2_005096 [Sinanodonta woodiana]|uniref:ENTH domain-containing protein n=1 Tax=Sinanodonta woodiana TaxID=1069815 RepID=A0ABD3VQA8_SINWO
MWKVREITDKVTNVVMNYSEVETKVREATNDEAWGPHGTLMHEIAQYTFTYEHFPEVVGMLWKRMLHDNKKNWRRVYKSLLLLTYLVKNGSERVVTSCREHLYDLRSLENYSFTDENGKDQGMNVRHKVKELIDFIQDDERLREERKKAKKNKDKYVGLASDSHSDGYRYSDRYDEEPRKREQLDEIDEWNNGKKSVVDEAVGKVKDLWNRAHGRRTVDDVAEYSGNPEKPSTRRDEVEFSDEPENKRADDDGDGKIGKKDKAEEFTSVERTQMTRTEKITTTTNRTVSRSSSSSGSKKLDLGAASNLGKSEAQSSSAITSGTVDLLGDIHSPTSTTSTNGDWADFNPRGTNTTTPDFGDFTQFNTSSQKSIQQVDSFSSLTHFNASNTSSVSSPTVTSSTELFDLFGSSSSQPLNAMTSAPLQSNVMGLQPNMMVSQPGMMGIQAGMMGTPPGMMGGQPGMMGGQPGMMGGYPGMMGIQAGMKGSQPGMMGSQPVMMGGQPGMMAGQSGMMGSLPNLMGGQARVMGMAPTSVPGMQTMGMAGSSMMGGTPQKSMMGMNQQPMMMQTGFMSSASQQPMMGTGMGYSSTAGFPMQSTSAYVIPAKNGPNTWSGDVGKINISLDGLSPASKYQKQVAPSINQLQQQHMQTTYTPGLLPQNPGMMVNPGMGGVTQGMSGLNLGQGSMMGMQQTTMGMQGNMMTAGVTGMHMQANLNMQSKVAFQQKTDQAFATFGNIGK